MLIQYILQEPLFQQVAIETEITRSGVYVLGDKIHLEQATDNDELLNGGVYITDDTYLPVLALDAS